MKNNIHSLLIILAIATGAQAQGPLTPPPGAPAPGMKSLDQIEARTPLNTLPGDASANHVISQPGSYYLTGPITGQGGKDGIRISAANVTLDLNGYTLTGVGGSNTAITLSVNGGPVTIRNGSIRSWVTGGIVGSNATHATFQDLAVSGISAGPGIFVGGHSLARRISVNGAHRAGIYIEGSAGIVSECTVENLGCDSWSLDANLEYVTGIGAGAISNSSVRALTKGFGTATAVYGINGQVAEHCIAGDFSLSGLNAFGIYAMTTRSCGVFNISCGSSEAVGISGAFIEGNTVRDVVGVPGIGIAAGGYNATILNNQLIRCPIQSGPATTISGNRVSEAGGKTAISVRFTGCNVTGNTVNVENGAGSRGIYVIGSSHKISGNIVKTGTGGIAIRVESSRCTVSENTIDAAADAVANGIYVTTGNNNNRIDGNTVSGGSVGINVAAGTNNIVARNSVSAAGIAYSLVAGTQAGPVVTSDDLTTASPWANLSQP